MYLLIANISGSATPEICSYTTSHYITERERRKKTMFQQTRFYLNSSHGASASVMCVPESASHLHMHLSCVPACGTYCRSWQRVFFSFPFPFPSPPLLFFSPSLALFRVQRAKLSLSLALTTPKPYAQTTKTGGRATKPVSPLVKLYWAFFRRLRASISLTLT